MVQIILAFFGSNLAMFIFIPIVIVLCAVAVIFAPILWILKLFGIGGDAGGGESDIPEDVQEQIDKQVQNAPDVGVLHIPFQYVAIYQMAAKYYNVPWALLAAIHKAETDFGRNIPENDNPAGHMQFTEARWAGEDWKHDEETGEITEDDEVDIKNIENISKGKGIGFDANSDQEADPWNAEDAIFSLGHFLKAKGVGLGSVDLVLEQAIMEHKDDTTFMETVMTYYYQLILDPSLQGIHDLQSGSTKQELFTSPDLIPYKASNKEVTWPVPFTKNVTKPFGYHNDSQDNNRSFHAGIDISTAGISGQPSLAMAEGKVIFAGERGGYGRTVVIDVGNGFTILYGHLQKIEVTDGQILHKGQTIGLIGTTGSSNAAHLHLEIRHKNVPVDPNEYMINGSFAKKL